VYQSQVYPRCNGDPTCERLVDANLAQAMLVYAGSSQRLQTNISGLLYAINTSEGNYGYLALQVLNDAGPLLVFGAIGGSLRMAGAVYSRSVQFGNVPNQVSHAFRYTDAAGLQREAVRSAVESHLKPLTSQIQTGKPFNQVIEIGGQRFQYTAYKLPDGTINVGRIHPANP
jgi:hypothetical protein